jgi:hypothetical protein
MYVKRTVLPDQCEVHNPISPIAWDIRRDHLEGTQDGLPNVLDVIKRVFASNLNSPAARNGLSSTAR